MMTTIPPWDLLPVTAVPIITVARSPSFPADTVPAFEGESSHVQTASYIRLHSLSGLGCSPSRCACPENCGNPFNCLKVVFGPAVSPIVPSECFKNWLRDRHVLKKPLDLPELFNAVHFELGRMKAPDTILDDWRAVWADLQTLPEHSSARRAHMQLLVRIAAAKDHPGRRCQFSFCLVDEPSPSGAWRLPGGKFRGHCSRCNTCRLTGTWHCSTCNACWGRDNHMPCFKCGGVQLDYLESRRCRAEPSDDGDSPASESG